MTNSCSGDIEMVPKRDELSENTLLELISMRQRFIGCIVNLMSELVEEVGHNDYKKWPENKLEELDKLAAVCCLEKKKLVKANIVYWEKTNMLSRGND